MKSQEGKYSTKPNWAFIEHLNEGQEAKYNAKPSWASIEHLNEESHG